MWLPSTDLVQVILLWIPLLRQLLPLRAGRRLDCGPACSPLLEVQPGGMTTHQMVGPPRSQLPVLWQMEHPPRTWTYAELLQPAPSGAAVQSPDLPMGHRSVSQSKNLGPTLGANLWCFAQLKILKDGIRQGEEVFLPPQNNLEYGTFRWHVLSHGLFTYIG